MAQRTMPNINRAFFILRALNACAYSSASGKFQRRPLILMLFIVPLIFVAATILVEVLASTNNSAQQPKGLDLLFGFVFIAAMLGNGILHPCKPATKRT